MSQLFTTLSAYAHNFHWELGVTPFSRALTVVGFIPFYLGVIFGLQWFMKDKKPIKPRLILILHNGFLTLISGALLVAMVLNLVPKLFSKGLRYGICSPFMNTDNSLVFMYYVNYLIKYYEMLDTVFLVLNKKPLKFLHVYHHAATMFLCWTQLVGDTSVQWVPIVLNLSVHVPMYYYYTRLTITPGVKIWWKKYLTTMQITQFVLDLFFVYYCTVFGNIYRDDPLPHSFDSWLHSDCYGTRPAGFTGCFILTSYLYLFVDFFIKTYSQPKTRPPRAEKKLN